MFQRLIKKGDWNLKLTVLSKPNVISIRKKMMDQKTEPSSVAMTSGYTTKTSPGPKNIKQNIKHNSYGVYNSLPNSVQNR